MKSEKSKAKFGVMALVLLLAVLAFTGTASAATIFVPTDYATIQEAVDAASPGDTVFVYNGTYYDGDGVKIEKDRITLQGEDANTTTIHGKWAAEGVVYVSGDFVSVSGFTVTGSSSYGSGIYLSHGSCNCRLSRNNATDNYFGIRLYYSCNNNNLTGNSANNNVRGISLSSSSNNNLTGNSANNNNDYGISLSSSSNNNLTGNSANNNNDYGISLSSRCNNNNLTGNSANNNNYGIDLRYSSNNNITGNSANNNYCGIRLYSSKNNELKGNTADANSYGIRFESTSTKNNITENTVSNNTNG